MGGAAILLSNRKADRSRSKYQLLHLVRTHKGADDEAYGCIHEQEDTQGIRGVSLSKDLMLISGEALKSNITTIGSPVLPASEQLLFLFTLISRKILKLKLKPYIPDFKQAFGHFCVHAGGRARGDRWAAEEAAVIGWGRRGVQDEAAPLWQHFIFTIWYEMSYTESKGRMKKGERVWQIALGSGFKCNNAVWKCNRTTTTPTDGLGLTALIGTRCPSRRSRTFDSLVSKIVGPALITH